MGKRVGGAGEEEEYQTERAPLVKQGFLLTVKVQRGQKGFFFCKN